MWQQEQTVRAVQGTLAFLAPSGLSVLHPRLPGVTPHSLPSLRRRRPTFHDKKSNLSLLLVVHGPVTVLSDERTLGRVVI